MEDYELYLKLKEKYDDTNSQEPIKKDRPILKIGIGIIITIVLILITLFTIGYIMGKNGYKPQKLDLEVFTNQIFEDNTEEYSELKKVEKSPQS